MRETIRAIITTLNGVEVRGKSNLDRLLACINALESLEAGLTPAATTEEREDAENG
nr:MAG TPA: hypothetical protein [Caudoviricetes sp.]